MRPLALPPLPHQTEAIEFALRNKRVYLALDMGTGKTVCGIGIVASSPTPALVVVPPSLRNNWKAEFAKFAPWLTVEVIRGTKVDALQPADVYVIGDSTLAHWAQHFTGRVHTLIVDEAHRHKNKSRRSEALKAVAESVKGPVVLMSGTPTPNGRHQELAQQIDILGPQAWEDIGGYISFWETFCPKVNSRRRGNANTDVLHQRLMSTWMMRRHRDDVLSLPSKDRQAVLMQCRGKPRDDYLRAESDLIGWLRDEGKDTSGAMRAEALVKLQTLRRLAGEGKVMDTVRYTKKHLAATSGGVFLVAEHKVVIERLLKHLSKYDPVVIRGGMSDRQKQSAVDAFVSGKSRVMVGQIISAGVGLTLHGNGLNNKVVIVQLPWTPADLCQAEDRVHRIGQTSDVNVSVALSSIDNTWTIDQRLYEVLNEKHITVGELIDGQGEMLLDEIIDGILDTYR